MSGPIALRGWTDEISMEAQCALEEALEDDTAKDIEFSFSIADPKITDCPLVAVSQGFTKLTGYTLQEAVGRSCRFLLNGVPPEMIDQDTRTVAREFGQVASAGETYRVSESLRKPWWPEQMPDGEALCCQANSRKDGTLFLNMFFMRQITLESHEYIVALQLDGTDTGIPFGDQEEGEVDVEKAKKAYLQLVKNMNVMQNMLNKQFYMEVPFGRRQHSFGDE